MNSRLPVALALALAGAACGLRPATETAAKDPAYVFPHSTHVDSDVACIECHASIPKAEKLEQGVRHVAIPPSPSKRPACQDCHDTDPELKIPARAREFRLRFSHAYHVERVGGDCKRCHTALTEPGDTQPKIPAMEICTSCHKHQMDFAQAACRPCHVDLRGLKPETAFKHEGNWLRAHGPLARPSAETCAQCHDQTYCTACHSAATAPMRPSILYPERVDRTFIHRGDYVSRHRVDAQANPADCRRCHGSGFCDACHEQQGLTKFADTTRDPHPAGWATPGNRPFHGDAARRNIATCAGCHDQGADATCVFCHRVGGIAGSNPHPGKFLSAHDRGDVADNAMCRACHG